MFPPTPPSSLLQRSPRSIRQQRLAANAAPYRSPRHRPRPAPLQNLTNVDPNLEAERAARRAAERVRQLALQETPSRRHRRTPARRPDENRSPSPTPAQHRTQPQNALGLPTPPASGRPGPAANPPEVNARALGQQRRRERERREREERERQQRLQAAAGPVQPRPIQPRPIQPHPIQRRPNPAPRPRPNPNPRSNAPAPARRRQVVLPPARSPYVEPEARHDLGRMNVKCARCGALHWLAEKVSSSSIRNPAFGMCCNHGKVVLDMLDDPPAELQALFVGTTPQANEFRTHIAQYNTALSFTSLGVHIDNTYNNGGGPYSFRIRGELCHRIGSLLPSEGQNPTYAQLYFHEPQAALDHRMRNNSNLRRDTMQTLQQVINANHKYAPYFVQAKELLANEVRDEISIRLRVAPGVHVRRGNLPTADEVAVIIPDQDNQQPRDIILRRRDGPLMRISDIHHAYTPLYYVLLFPYGEDGWDEKLTMHEPDKDKPKRLSQTRYVAYRLHQREDEAKTVLRGGRLLQRYMVDMWASADQNRLKYFRFNQGTIRAELYSGLADAIEAGDEDMDLNGLGRRVVLPATYVGGPRDRGQRYQDSMALARYYRSVDLFITVITNPEWPEIQRELLPGQNAADRPDLVSRVFRLKMDAIINDIEKEGVFGRSVAHVYAIEFQKRGLPHMHLLLFLEPGQKILTPEDIDSVIWARWPDVETQPMLFETVKKCMVHGPCGVANPRSPCMENGRCTKGFPKAFTDHTIMDDKGYPQYYRPDDGRSFDVRGHMIDNRWIVPYCPFFSAKYHCHINVECAVSLGSFKYAFKYIQKGGDMAGIQVEDKNDEIKRWVEGRYISAAEAAWRIYHFEMFSQTPNVVRLQVHLPGQHLVTFDANEDPAEILDRAAGEQTSLTAFFAANADNGGLGLIARQYTYQEFPQHFVLKGSKNNRHWAIRKQGKALGRMYFVPPNAGERFYLRTLLTVVKGPTSFANLRTYNGTVYPTFLDACLARGLLEDDGEWRQCLAEASEMQTGSRLRQLFATLLIFCEPTRPGVLWEEFREHICDDLQHRLRQMGRLNPTAEDAYDYGLHLIDKLLKESGYSIEKWPAMPRPQIDWGAEVINPLIADQLDYDVASERENADRQIPLLNQEQRDAFDKIIDSVHDCSGKTFFLNGPGGTGKTFVYKTLCYALRAEGLIVLCVASSGIAALLLVGGRTSHSVFKIPIDGLFDGSFCNIEKHSQRADLMRRVSLIIWDEIGMQHRHAVEAVDRTLRDIMDVDRPFGGITTVVGGDFQQILPVVPKGSREMIVGACIRRSALWARIEVLRLHQNMRLATSGEDERDFAAWLLDIGSGRNLDDGNMVPLREGMQCESPESLIDFVYPGISSIPPPPPEYFLNRMLLASRNADIFDLNATVLDSMSGESRTYVSADKVVEEAGADGPRDDNEMPVPVEFLRSLNSGSLPPGELSMKVGCPLLLLRNLSPALGLCNGTRMTLLRMSERVLECRVIGGDHDGSLALIPRISLTPSNTTEFSFKFTRRQFPIRLAFALTINKAQGQSVKYVGLDLRIPVFSHGQLYVAFSRATSSQRIKVLLPETSDGPEVANVVYSEVLLDNE